MKNQDKPLSTIIEAQAKIAMPEMVNVFLTQYETSLYDKKTELKEKLIELEKQKEMHTESTRLQNKFTKYDGVKIQKFNLISDVSKNISIRWDKQYTYVTVHFKELEKDKKYIQHNDMSYTLYADISDSNLAKYDELSEAHVATHKELEQVLAQIGNMSRKERQVKARISQLRLQEQGLEGFLEDPEMKKLIQI